MKEVKEIPKTGQFVAIWENENGIWSQAYKWSQKGVLLKYCDYRDEFDECHYDLDIRHDIRYFVTN